MDLNHQVGCSRTRMRAECKGFGKQKWSSENMWDSVHTIREALGGHVQTNKFYPNTLHCILSRDRSSLSLNF